MRVQPTQYQSMTFEEFRELTVNPPSRDEETIFEVTEYDIQPLPERLHLPQS